MAFLPQDFTVPAVVETPRFRMRSITIHDVVRDYDAVMSSREHLWRRFGDIWGWPAATLTIDDNLVDLGWHQKEFALRSSFDYAIVSLDEKRILGCVYVDPPRVEGSDADIWFWARQSELASGLEDELRDFLLGWLGRCWPFATVTLNGTLHSLAAAHRAARGESQQLELQPATHRRLPVRYYGEEDIGRVLHMPDLIRTMREVLIEFSQGGVAQPARRLFPTPRHAGFFAAMPTAGAHALGAKLVTFFPGNAERGLHTHNALIALFDPKTGEPLTLMDGRLITEMRTAAVTATFVDAVAAADVTSLAILGAGTQGRAHLEALKHVRDFTDIRIWNRTRERAEQLAHDAGGRAMGCEDAVRDADVVVVATASAEPVLNGAWLKTGAKVASVGWRGPDGAELDAATMAHTVIVDSREGAATESGNVRRYSAHIFAELGEVLAGSKVPDPHATVVFDSIGMACEDIAAATLVFERLAGMTAAAAARAPT